MIGLPWSPAVVLLAWPAGWAYLRAGALAAKLPRRIVRVLLATLVASTPLLTTGPGPAQLTIGLVCAFLALRMASLGARPRRMPASLGAAFRLLAVADDSVLAPGPPLARGAAPALALALASGAAGIGLLLWGNAALLWRGQRFLDDVVVCAEVLLAMTAVNNLVLGLASALGRPVVGLQARPALSASVGEFWGVRWNRLVAAALAGACFAPLRRRPALAVTVTFAASGALHVVPVVAFLPPAAALRPAALVFAFFLLHGALMLAERRLGWHRVPETRGRLLLARLRTTAIVVGTSPLLLDVYADIAGIHGRGL